MHAVDVLIVDADHERQRVADLDVLGHESLARLPEEDPHAGGGHGGRGGEGRGAQRAATTNLYSQHSATGTRLYSKYGLMHSILNQISSPGPEEENMQRCVVATLKFYGNLVDKKY